MRSSEPSRPFLGSVFFRRVMEKVDLHAVVEQTGRKPALLAEFFDVVVFRAVDEAQGRRQDPLAVFGQPEKARRDEERSDQRRLKRETEVLVHLSTPAIVGDDRKPRVAEAARPRDRFGIQVGAETLNGVLQIVLGNDHETISPYP